MSFSQIGLPKKGEQTVRLETTQGNIFIRLFPQNIPKTVENFLGLVERKYYDGTISHRVIRDFMIQGGDPTGTGRGDKSIWGVPFDKFTIIGKMSEALLAWLMPVLLRMGPSFFVAQTESTP